MSKYVGILCHKLLYTSDYDEAFVKNLPKLKKVIGLAKDNQDAVDYWSVLGAVCSYFDKHAQTPPSRKALDEFAKTSTDHAIRTNLMIGETIRAIAPEDFEEAELKAFTDPLLLVEKVIEDGNQEHLANLLRVAQLIAVAGPTKQMGKFKDPSGLEDARAALIKGLVDMADDSDSEPDPHEYLLKVGDSPSQMRVVSAANIATERLEWLWKDKIPQGKISLYVGKPDNGKSLAALDLISRVTRGADFPDGSKNTLGAKKVLCSFSEDDEAQTIVPRLMASGADLSKVIFLRKVVDTEGFKRSLALKEDALLLQKALIADPEIALVVLDPITAFIGDADLNRDKDIRPVLEALGAALIKSKATCVGIIHCNKRSDVDALGKILGGSSVAGVVRAAWDFSKVKGEEGYKMTHIKGNLTKKKVGLNYETEGVMVKIADGSSQEHPRVKWLTECEETANDVLDKNREKPDRVDAQTSAATSLLMMMLDGAGAFARDIARKGEAEGIGYTTIKNASYKMGVKRKNVGDGWWWYLPEKAAAYVERTEAKLEDVEVM